MAVKQKILEKLSKLRAMATQNASPEEAANATALLQDLLFQHNLTENDLVGIEEAPPYEKEYFDLKVKTAKWRAHLINSIAENNFCKVILTGSAFVILIGQEENRHAVKYLYSILADDLERICKQGVKVAKKERPYIDGTLWNKSFYLGAVSTISKRLKEQKKSSIDKANEAKAGSGTALAIKVDNALRDATKALVGVTKTTTTRSTRIDGAGYASGVMAGNNAKLNESIPQRRTALNK